MTKQVATRNNNNVFLGNTRFTTKRTLLVEICVLVVLWFFIGGVVAIGVGLGIAIMDFMVWLYRSSKEDHPSHDPRENYPPPNNAPR